MANNDHVWRDRDAAFEDYYGASKEFIDDRGWRCDACGATTVEDRAEDEEPPVSCPECALPIGISAEPFAAIDVRKNIKDRDTAQKALFGSYNRVTLESEAGVAIRIIYYDASG